MYQSRRKDFLLKYMYISFAIFNIFTYASHLVIFVQVCMLRITQSVWNEKNAEKSAVVFFLVF